MNREDLLFNMASKCNTWHDAVSLAVGFEMEHGRAVHPLISKDDWLREREKVLLNKYKHDWWGQTGDEFFEHPDLGDLIYCLLEQEVDNNDDYKDHKDVSGIFEVSGGDVTYAHISGVISHVSDAENYLSNSCYGDDTIRETREYSREQFIDSLEECFEEWIDEGNDYGRNEVFSMSKNSAKTVGRIYYRAAKEFQKAFNKGDDYRMKVVARTFMRRFQRAVRHSPKEKCYCLWNGKDYDVTISEGIVTDIVQTNEY